MTVPAQLSPRVAALLKKTRASRGRLVFALDATASREPTWDMASQLTSQMFEQAARIGGLDVQLVWYRGHDECSHTEWIADAHELIGRMSTIRCMAGATKIARVLEHIRTEHEHEKVAAAVFVGDAVEEPPLQLYAAAAGCPPLFCFQEGDAPAIALNQHGLPIAAFDAPLQKVETIFRELARVTGGAYARFDAGAAGRLGELLAAVAAFAVGGEKALANQNTDSARKLLGQIRS